MTLWFVADDGNNAKHFRAPKASSLLLYTEKFPLVNPSVSTVFISHMSLSVYHHAAFISSVLCLATISVM